MASIKVITIGEAGVGKTALTMRYANNTYGLHEMTIGVDFAIKRLNDGRKIQIWDTAGQESFRSISRSYYRGAHAALIVFSLDDIRSFQKLQYWYEDLKQINKNALCVLVGTKSDQIHKISKNQIENLCQLLNIEYFETSSKSSENVAAPFEYIYSAYKTEKLKHDTNIQLQNTQLKSSQTCCL
jgi:small GTP-binding protein